MIDILFTGLQTLNQIFQAGIAITAFSLLLRALSFNLRDRVSRSFAVILACMMVMFTGEALATTIADRFALEFWLRFRWIGVLFLPAAYVHFSDALLATTGRPSRGRRRFAVRLGYILSLIFLLMLPSSILLGPLTAESSLFPHLERTPLSFVFTFYYVLSIAISASFLWRAYQRTRLKTSRRRMSYLFLGAVSLAVGLFPYLLFGLQAAEAAPLVFSFFAAVGNTLVFVSLMAMAYAVAFFGVAWPDRMVRSRLFKWLLRGPVTVFIVLALTNSARQIGETFSIAYLVAIPVLTAITVLLMEHAITLGAPLWERLIFNEGDGGDLRLLESLQERLITTNDLRQFLEAVLAAVCDQLQVSTSFIAALDAQALELVVSFGDRDLLPDQSASHGLLNIASGTNGQEELFAWGDFWLLPLYSQDDELIGLLGVLRREDQELEEEQRQTLFSMGERAALALEDRRLQRQVFRVLETLNPKVEVIQRLRAAARYDQSEVLLDPSELSSGSDLAAWVKDALTHYWGGPKLTESPLLRLRVVQEALEQHDGNPTNALRSILQQAVEQVRPVGERRFTAEWILYNILELKFMQGRKVREVAMRLAMSEADLYRKQRVAIEAVADAIVEMEQSVRT